VSGLFLAFLFACLANDFSAAVFLSVLVVWRRVFCVGDGVDVRAGGIVWRSDGQDDHPRGGVF
jgi:hypothetical protein